MPRSLQLALGWLGVGLVASVCGFGGLLGLPLWWLLTVPIFLLGRSFREMSKELVVGNGRVYFPALYSTFALLGIWVMHAVGIFVPETAFDAVWYHLPVVARFAELGRITYLPELYQSANPLLVDIIFFLGYQLAGEAGAKIVAWLLGLSLLVIAYQIAKRYLATIWLVLFLIAVSLIQPIAWQSSSFYVDIGKAFWELVALYLVLTINEVSVTKNIQTWQRTFLIGAFVGASIATKAFSLLLLPLFGLILVIMLGKENKIYADRSMAVMVVVMLAGVVAVAFPYYLYTWLSTGNPLMSVTLHVGKLGEIGGQSHPLRYVIKQAISLPYSLWYLVAKARDSVSLLIGVGFVLASAAFLGHIRQKRFQLSKELFVLILFAGYQWLVWWFVPPVSTRYALSGFVIVVLLAFRLIQHQASKSAQWFWALLFMVVVAHCWQLAPRLFVVGRNVAFISGRQSKAAFIEQFYDGNSDQHLRKWHRLTE